MARRRDLSRASQALEISSCTTMPSHCGATSMPRTSAALSMMPSDSEKPNAKSSRSAGVASMVAWLMPLYSSATGVSSARWSASVVDATAPARIRVTWAGMLS